LCLWAGSLEALDQQSRCLVAELFRRLADSRYGWEDHVRQIEIIKGDKRNIFAQTHAIVLQATQGRDGADPIHGDNCIRLVLLQNNFVEPPPRNRTLMLHKRNSELQFRFARGVPITSDAFHGGVKPGACRERKNPLIPVFEQMLDRVLRAAPVVNHHGIE